MLSARFRRRPGRSALDDFFEAAGLAKDVFGHWGVASPLPDEETFDLGVGNSLPGGLGVDYDQVRDFPEIPLELMDKTAVGSVCGKTMEIP